MAAVLVCALPGLSPELRVAAITFAAMPYSLPDVGSHTYTVVEKKNGIAGIIYDDLQWTLNTTVTDLGDGTLNVTYTLSRQEAP